MRISAVLALSLAIGSSAYAQHAGHAGGGFASPHGFTAPHVSSGFATAPSIGRPVQSIGLPPRSIGLPPQSIGNTPAGANWRAPVYNRFPLQNWGSYRPRYTPSPYRRPYAPYLLGSSAYFVPGVAASDNGYYDPDQEAPAPDDSQAQNSEQAQAEQLSGYDEQHPPLTFSDNPPPPPGGEPAPPPQASITLVFKDGHQQQIHSYMLTQTRIYLLDDAASGRRPEIPLSQLDIAATQKINSDAGIDFNIPAAN